MVTRALKTFVVNFKDVKKSVSNMLLSRPELYLLDGPSLCFDCPARQVYILFLHLSIFCFCVHFHLKKLISSLRERAIKPKSCTLSVKLKNVLNTRHFVQLQRMRNSIEIYLLQGIKMQFNAIVL